MVCRDSRDCVQKGGTARSGTHVCWGLWASGAWPHTIPTSGRGAHWYLTFQMRKWRLKQLRQTCHRQCCDPDLTPRYQFLTCNSASGSPMRQRSLVLRTQGKEFSSTGCEHLLWIFVCKNDLELEVSFFHRHKSSETKQSLPLEHASSGWGRTSQPMTINDSSSNSQEPVEFCALLASLVC